MMAITPIIGEEMICEEMQGMVLIHHTGIINEEMWYTMGGAFSGSCKFENTSKILRSIYRLAYRNNIDEWVLRDDWGALWYIVDDDGRAIIATRRHHDISENCYQTIIFATSESFWTKMVLKYR